MKKILYFFAALMLHSSLFAQTVSTYAGTGTAGFADGPAATAQFNVPRGIAVDKDGNVYVTDQNNFRIRKITPAGVVSTLAGSGTQGFADGPGTEAKFDFLAGIAVDNDGNVYVGDASNQRIRKITPAGVVSTYAGTGTAGSDNGPAATATLNGPWGVAIDASNNLYVSDFNGNRIRKITPTGVVSTLAGTGAAGFADGAGTTARFSNPTGVAVDASGNVYVGDRNNARIRKITPTGDVSTLAGSGTSGFADGPGATAQFSAVFTFVTMGADGNLYVSDGGNNRIRKVTPAGIVSTVAGSGTAGFADGPAATAQFNGNRGIAFDNDGNMYAADFGNNRIRKIAATATAPCASLVIGAPTVGFIVCQGGETTIRATASGGSGTYQYSLNGGTYQTSNVFNVQAGRYTITAKDGNACTISTAATTVNDGFPAMQCPQPMTVDAAQMGANGSVPTSTSGNVNIIGACFTPSSTAVTDQVFDVTCGVVSPQTNSFSQTSLVDVQKVILRAFSANSGIITQTCYQTIFVRQPKLEDVVFPTNRTLTCTNLRTEPTDAVVNNAVVTGTGSPSSDRSTLNTTPLKGLTATFTDVRTTTPTGFTIQRTWTVSKCGTTRVVVQTITVPTCTTPSIAGSIGREDGTKVPATTLLFNSLTGRTDSTTGITYSFANILTNSNVRVKPTRPNTDWTSGVTMLDVSLLSRHVLDLNPLSSPYSIISADVNGDGEADATDMLLMQRLILRLIPALPNNNSWRFVVKNHVFRNPTNPLADDFPEILVVPNMTAALENGDFVAIKVGDLNQSAGAVTIRGGAKAFVLNTEDIILEKGKTYQIPIQINPSVNSLQFTLNVDKNAAKIESLQMGDLPNFTDNNAGLFQKEGMITAAWYKKDGQSVSETDKFTMMTLTLKPTTTARLSEIMTINSAYTEGVAYDAKGTGLPVQLAFGNKTSSSEKAVLLANRPNPFSNQTTLSFTLPEASVAKLTVCDLLGKVLMTSDKQFTKGLNEVVFDAANTPSVSGGIFVVRLQTATGVAEQKIVLQR
jgi:Dockerin type I domain/NHL repeat